MTMESTSGSVNRFVKPKIWIPEDLGNAAIRGERYIASFYINQDCGRASLKSVEQTDFGDCDKLKSILVDIFTAYKKYYIKEYNFCMTLIVNPSKEGGIGFNFYIDHRCLDHDDRDKLSLDFVTKYMRSVIEFMEHRRGEEDAMGVFANRFVEDLKTKLKNANKKDKE